MDWCFYPRRRESGGGIQIRIYLSLYIYICLCVCVCVSAAQWRTAEARMTKMSADINTDVLMNHCTFGVKRSKVKVTKVESSFFSHFAARMQQCVCRVLLFYIPATLIFTVPGWGLIRIKPVLSWTVTSGHSALLATVNCVHVCHLSQSSFEIYVHL